MFWADTIVDEVCRRYKREIEAGTPVVVRDEKTASGTVHVGSLRSAALHALVVDVLRERGVPVTFFFEINDFDAMDGIPSYLDASTYQQYMGVPLCNIPSPEPGYENFAELYGQEYVRVLEGIGFSATVYRASELYRSGAMNDLITKALERKAVIREIYKKVSGSEKKEGWYPFNVICEKCGNLSATSITDFDGETVEYLCSDDTVAWAKGCGHRARISPYNGNGKFPWKVDWAAKFVSKGVHFEGGGKDHYTKGGARHVAEAIAREVFDHEPPYGVFNEFFLVGGKKMSSSKGNAATAVEMSELLPPALLRFLLIRLPINRQLNFDPQGDAVPNLYDAYDAAAEVAWEGVVDDVSRAFILSQLPEHRQAVTRHFLPRFSQVAFLVQMPHMILLDEMKNFKGDSLASDDVSEIEIRAQYAHRWLNTYADEQFVFTLQNTVPPEADMLSLEQKQALSLMAQKISESDDFSGQYIHELTHQVKEESGLDPKTFFSAIYMVFLGKTNGPKVGWFLSTLKKEFVISRLTLTA